MLALNIRFSHGSDAIFMGVRSLLCAVLVMAPTTSGAGEPRHVVGLADGREGYDNASFATRSKAIIESSGERLSLQQLSQGASLGLPPLTVSLRSAEVDLGRKLFFDRRLSANETLSCGLCHIPEQGFTQNELATPVGNEGKGVRRNAPSLYNVVFAGHLFWDGREASLEDQVWSPLLALNEMANPSRKAVIERLRQHGAYSDEFSLVYEQGLTQATFASALAAYQQSLVAGSSRFDHWYFPEANPANQHPSILLSEEARRGFDVYQRSGCGSCHTLAEKYALFTDGQFHNTGVAYHSAVRGIKLEVVQVAPGLFIEPTVEVETETFVDNGRAEVTRRQQDHWRYRTPTLRNVAITAPYMHDGSFRTLSEVLDYYEQGGSGDPHQDPRIQPFVLTAAERLQLLAFLHSLTSDGVDALVADARSVPIGERGTDG